MIVSSIQIFEGFGTDTGVSAGELFNLGIGDLMSGEGGDEKNYYGGYISTGIGVEWAGISGHVNMTETSPSFYPFKVPEYIVSGIKGWFSCDE